MFRTAKIVALVLLLSPITAQVVETEYTYVVLGQAIDTSGQPVPFARIVMAPGRNNEGGDFIYIGNADAQGRIRFEVNDSTLAKPTREMYATGPRPSNAIALIEPPFDEYPLTRPPYNAQHIVIRKNSEVNLGAVPIRVFYHIVKVLLRDRLGGAFLKDAEAWRRVALRIRNEKGHFIEETSISRKQIEQAVNLTDSSVALALPEGKWRIEISLGEGEEWLSSGTSLQVKASDEQLQLTLKAR